MQIIPNVEPLGDPLPPAENPAAVYLAGLTSSRSRRTMSNALRTIVALVMKADLSDVTEDHMYAFNWAGLRYPHTAAIRARLNDRYSTSTTNRMLSALRGVLKESWRLGLMSAEDYQRAVDISNVRGESVPAGRELSSGEILALVQTCKADESPIGVRDAAIIGLLYTCGLRREELVSLSSKDFDSDTGKLAIRRGKGNKGRIVFVQGGALQALRDWVEVVGRVDPDEALFLPIRKDGVIDYRQLAPQSIYDILKRRAAQAGVKDFSPHDLRRTFVGDLLERGVDIATVANIAGHSSVDTTRRYDRRPEETKREAAKKLHFPY